MTRTRTITATALAFSAMTILPAQAGVFTYEATLNDISGLGGSGKAMLTFDDLANTLQVDITGKGFTPNMLHVQHIHGPTNPDGTARNAVTPTLADDTDGDGVVELVEGLPLYGGILLSLFDEGKTDNGFNGFPSVTDMDGTLAFNYTYDLTTTTALNTGVTAKDLFPLDFREIVIHGAFLSPGIGGIGNETEDNALLRFGGYSNFVPVAAGEIVQTAAPVPLPAAGWALIAALGGLGAVRARRRQKP